jgi:hypothetical protein
MLSEAEDKSENGAMIYPTSGVPHDLDDDPIYFRYQTTRGRTRTEEYQMPHTGVALWRPYPADFIESLDFSLVAKAMIRGTQAPPGASSQGLTWITFDYLFPSPDLRGVPELDIGVFDANTKALRGRIKLQFCGYLQAMASTMDWYGGDLLLIGAPCCGGENIRKIFGYFPKD